MGAAFQRVSREPFASLCASLSSLAVLAGASIVGGRRRVETGKL